MRPRRLATLNLNRSPVLSPVGPTSSLLASDLYYHCLSFAEPTDYFLSVEEWLRSLSCILHMFFSSSVSYWSSFHLVGSHCIALLLFLFCFLFLYLGESPVWSLAPASTAQLPSSSTVRGNQATRWCFLTLCGLTGAAAQTEVLFMLLALKPILLVWKVNLASQFWVTNESRDFLTKPPTSITMHFVGSVGRIQWW